MEYLKGLEFIEQFGPQCNGKDMFVYDEGCRLLKRCPICDALVLDQLSIYHNYCADPDDEYYHAFFPVSSREEVLELNEKYDGMEILKEFKGPIIQWR